MMHIYVATEEQQNTTMSLTKMINCLSRCHRGEHQRFSVNCLSLRLAALFRQPCASLHLMLPFVSLDCIIDTWAFNFTEDQGIEEIRKKKEGCQAQLKRELSENPINTTYEKMVEAIQSAAIETLKKTKHTKRTEWYESLREKLNPETQIKRKLKHSWLSNPAQENLFLYKQQRNKIAAMIRKEKKTYIEEKKQKFPEQLTKHEPRKAYKVLREALKEDFSWKPSNEKTL